MRRLHHRELHVWNDTVPVRLYQLRRGKFVLAVVCFLGIVLIGVIQDIFIAVGLALLGFI